MILQTELRIWGKTSLRSYVQSQYSLLPEIWKKHGLLSAVHCHELAISLCQHHPRPMHETYVSPVVAETVCFAVLEVIIANIANLLTFLF